MFRIDHPTAVPDMPPFGALGTQGWFTEGNPLGGQMPTQVTAEFLNMIIAELTGVLTAAGMTTDKANNAQLRQALMILIGPRRPATNRFLAQQ